MEELAIMCGSAEYRNEHCNNTHHRTSRRPVMIKLVILPIYSERE